VPFGLSNAPTIFMCLMNGMLREYLKKFVIVLLYDIIIYSKYEEEHEENLRMVLKFLRENKLYAKLTKCIFYQKKINYLGNTISTDGTIVDPEKTEAIIGWPIPRNVMEVRSFMSLTIYYRRFIIVFSNIAIPITSLQNKGVKFKWTP
jgi:hypothetical protein